MAAKHARISESAARVDRSDSLLGRFANWFCGCSQPLTRRVCPCCDCGTGRDATQRVLNRRRSSFRRRATIFNAGSAGSAGNDDDSQEELALRHGAVLVNYLISKKWPYISEWFGNTIRETLTPLLQSLIQDLMNQYLGYAAPEFKLNFDTCNLGSTPIELQNITTSVCQQDWPEEPPGATNNVRTNVRIVGDVDWAGDATISASAQAGANGTVELTNLKIRGTLVIELVKLTSLPPWFSGVRIFFPSSPHIEIDARTDIHVPAIGALVRAVDLTSRVRKLVLDNLAQQIANYAVLPNRFAIPVGGPGGIDPFHLRHPLPEGVLRLQVVGHSFGDNGEASSTSPSKTQAVGDESPASPREPLKATSAPAAAEKDDVAESAESPRATNGGRWFWRSWASKKVGRVTTEVVLRGHSPLTGCGDAQDYLIAELRHQKVRVAVSGARKNKTLLGDAEVPLATLVQQQRGGGAGELVSSLTRVPLQRAGTSASGWVELRAEWRPLPSADDVATELLTQTPEESCWSFGRGAAGADQPVAAPWLLVAYVYDATGLSAQHGTQHWVSLEVGNVGAASSSTSERQMSVAMQRQGQPAMAKRPMEHGTELLQKLSITQEAKEGFCHDVKPETWRHLLRRYCTESPSLLDVMWEEPFLLLLDAEKSVYSSLFDTDLVLRVWRPATGTQRRPDQPSTEVGSARYSLRRLVEQHGYREEAKLRLQSAGEATPVEVRICVQARPLLPAPDMRNTSWAWMANWALGLRSRARTDGLPNNVAVMAPRASIFGRVELPAASNGPEASLAAAPSFFQRWFGGGEKAKTDAKDAEASSGEDAPPTTDAQQPAAAIGQDAPQTKAPSFFQRWLGRSQPRVGDAAAQPTGETVENDDEQTLSPPELVPAQSYQSVSAFPLSAGLAEDLRRARMKRLEEQKET